MSDFTTARHAEAVPTDEADTISDYEVEDAVAHVLRRETSLPDRVIDACAALIATDLFPDPPSLRVTAVRMTRFADLPRPRDDFEALL